MNKKGKKNANVEKNPSNKVEEGLESKKEKMGVFKVARFLFSQLQIPKDKYFIPFAIALLRSVIALIVPLYMKNLVDLFQENSPVSELLDTLYILLLLTSLNFFMNFLTQRFFQKLGIHSIYELRQTLFAHIQGLSMKYYDTHKTGKIMSFLTNDADSVNNLISTAFINLILQFIQLVGSLGFMLYVSLEMSVIIPILVPLIFIFSKRFSKKSHGAWKLVRESVSEVTGEIQESIDGLRTIKAFKTEEYAIGKLNKVIAEEKNARKNASNIWAKFMPLNYSIAYISVGLAILIGAYSHESMGNIFAFILYYQSFTGPLQGITSFFNQIQSSVAGGERLIDLLNTKSEIEEASDPQILVPGEHTVRFEDVTFSYGKEDVLKNIKIEIPPHHTLAIVGPTGAGKTTFASLIPRFYDIQSGNISINDLSIQRYSLKSLRSNIGIVLQDNYLFATSIWDNIRMGNPQASDEEIITITKKIGLHYFLSNLPKGYDTVVGERGAILSVGQRQLIAFARTLLSNPSILILDEATSSVDAYSEILIQQALATLLKERTCIVIAHRLSTIVNADTIIFILDGRIIEQGTHSELMKINGHYANFYKMQFANNEI